eukprot:g4540.t1
MYKPCIIHTMKSLKRNKCEIFTKIDATTISRPSVRKIIDPEKQGFDRIVWNFPHGGFPETKEHHHGPGFEWGDFLEKHASLVRGFISQTRELLRPNGLVIITNKSIEPFSLWNIPKMAKAYGFNHFIEESFNIDDYPGFQNRRGAGKRAAKRFPCNDAKLYAFGFK